MATTRSSDHSPRSNGILRRMADGKPLSWHRPGFYCAGVHIGVSLVWKLENDGLVRSTDAESNEYQITEKGNQYLRDLER